jgi:hypothetical protein
LPIVLHLFVFPLIARDFFTVPVAPFLGGEEEGWSWSPSSPSLHSDPVFVELDQINGIAQANPISPVALTVPVTADACV